MGGGGGGGYIMIKNDQYDTIMKELTSELTFLLEAGRKLHFDTHLNI